MITATLGAQCMNWETSPAAAELEEKMMVWLRDLTGLPGNFEGVIQDSASTATLAAILTAREKSTDFLINNNGFRTAPELRVYCSEQGHSSVEKAVKISGIGKSNLVRIPVRDDFSMDPVKLDAAVSEDIKKGYHPCCVIATIGTTGTTAIDPLQAIGEICHKNNIWLHVDAAMAGTALILPEFQWMIEGKERNIYEEWRIENDTLMSSYSYYVEKGDTSYSETVELKKTGGDIFYIPSVEYNAGPVKFKLISLIKNKAVFENPQNDFPTKIIYEKISNDRLHASIEGMIEGKLKVIEYNFKRIR